MFKILQRCSISKILWPRGAKFFNAERNIPLWRSSCGLVHRHVSTPTSYLSSLSVGCYLHVYVQCLPSSHPECPASSPLLKYRTSIFCQSKTAFSLIQIFKASFSKPCHMQLREKSFSRCMKIRGTIFRSGNKRHQCKTVLVWQAKTFTSGRLLCMLFIMLRNSSTDMFLCKLEMIPYIPR